MLITVALAMTREVSELVVYYSGIAEAAIFPVLTGSLIGLGIGLSVGALLYYALLNLTYSVAVLSSKILLIITASGLLSQAIGFLIQADIISSQAPLWDSSSILAEESLVGQLLYALLAYEATPAAAQVFAWCISTALLSLGVFLHSKRSAERA
jgi:high-affinity iron transporter